MSYARFSETSSVYVYADCSGSLVCCACSLGDDWRHASTDAILAHLQKHIDAGHDVPDYCIEGLNAERDENDAFIAHMRAGGDEDSFVWKGAA